MAVGAPQLYALIGHPVAGNPTEQMLEAAFAAAGVNARYVSIDVAPEGLADAVAGLRSLGFSGFHVTVPHKVAVVPMLDRLQPAAQLAGAVNCVKLDRGELVGDNTDGRGFIEALAALRDIEGMRAVVLGAGGAARAIVAELALAGAREILIVNRTAETAAEVAASIGSATGVLCRAGRLVPGWQVPGDADVVVQATNVGMDDPAARLPLAWSPPHAAAVAADVVIDPTRTGFLEDAAAAGYATLDGLGMLVGQAAIGFRWWSGASAGEGVLRAALREALHGRD